MTDPFDVVKDEVKESLRVVKNLYEKFKILISKEGENHVQLSQSDKEEKDYLKREISKKLKDIEYDVDDLEETVIIVEKNPAKFTHFDPEDISARKQFILATKGEISSIKRDIEKKSKSDGGSGNKGNITLNKKSYISTEDQSSNLDDQYFGENQEFIDQQMMKQRNIIDEQDTHLDQVGRVVDDVKDVAIEMRDELESHNRLLTDLEGDVSRTQSFLNRVQRKLNGLLKGSNDRGKIICIIVLVIIIAVMVLGLVALEGVFNIVKI